MADTRVEKLADLLVNYSIAAKPGQKIAIHGSTLAEPLIRYPVDFVVHGHAHRGFPQGQTVNGTPVYNVAMPLLLRSFPDRPAFRILEVPRDGEADRPQVPAS